jgi:hypothetical protein
MVFISGLIVFNLILSAGQFVPHGGDHFWTWNKPYGFASPSIVVRTGADDKPAITITGDVGHLASLWTAITAVVWSLVGFETIAVTGKSTIFIAV